MKKAEIITRIAYIALCILNIGSIFFGLMVLFSGKPEYGFFRSLSLLFAAPMFFMRLIFFQYIAFFVLSVLSVLIYIKKIKNRSLNKLLFIDIALWLFTFIEMLCTENYFWNIVYF